MTDQDQLPPVSLQLLDAAYPGVEARPDLRARYKLGGDGPWNVVLAGYVLNALDRPVDAIRREPYQPVPGDGFFPRKNDETKGKETGKSRFSWLSRWLRLVLFVAGGS